ncbi:DUF1284 domain-containing protein [Niallia taxi]|uniref:DUF1284 domain-containing protein n=1 Tax=Niallia taxi TaxID=2499688 RepID=UPI002E1D5F7B|nr:DUF1284 domain-containing protein [Niallia taxi]
MYKLRGHHLFCLLGYRGMGYSAEYVQNMTKLHQTLRKNPDTFVQIVDGPDQLCEKYPNSGKYHCLDSHIYDRDSAFLEKLGLHVGEIIRWRDIETAILTHAVPSDIPIICETCSWRSYGVCEEGIQELHEGKPLREIKD